MLMFDGFAEMTFTILRLEGFYKQRGTLQQQASVFSTLALHPHVTSLFTASCLEQLYLLPVWPVLSVAFQNR